VKGGNVASASNVRTFAILSLLTADRPIAFGFPPMAQRRTSFNESR